MLPANFPSAEVVELEALGDELMDFARAEGEKMRVRGSYPQPTSPDIDHLLRADLRLALWRTHHDEG